ncbi:MAG: hypothetical protein A3E07_01190 [Candidatus Wildermuthbacteria bacterium RIFCSPHIGHO2_12_FULL_45_9]|uniref:Uncharacterized protein n=1 Tax=Candidatus Wildermuthbacteria bacterium RIFCSPHIGHO2_02_FULL_45_25 TaxID=1802450 RepID=A0A1G2QZ51_9BACT|nr:MAG: hypothetical protein A2748_02230 [Candidatus Wildermuthbacteria bacterium RIFCSPHIGHO2_01_FULL_45_20]OHA65737.1 MAG: hypothetical protein A3C04_02370 [Candidatus Wildermuthbacteria bacterium RIFCSPHIGHO2_02_FULL_45_25]OHA70892.1 MAG: hypothetical protein A3E07_01190 [Candidatus Wildermuthbacteria bacterium RIFCSPHIGHO2_12_FULL_45_9]
MNKEVRRGSVFAKRHPSNHPYITVTLKRTAKKKGHVNTLFKGVHPTMLNFSHLATQVPTRPLLLAAIIHEQEILSSSRGAKNKTKGDA